MGIVLGSGLGAVAERIETEATIPFAELPGFPRPAVEGHGHRVRLGRLGGLKVACLEGRAHYYETGSTAAMAAPIRALREAGAQILFLTNAAGSLRPEIGPGQLLLVTDHINLLPGNPLVGPNDERIGPRFPSLRDAYDPALRALLRDGARRLGIPLAEGVYAAYPGPSFETPAEIRMIRGFGADAVGMSTVPETILARHCGLRVAAVSVIANLAEGLGPTGPSHAETLAATRRAAKDLARLVEDFCKSLAAQ
ncbi:MAG: purine-nucleoside phosphorylase [Rhodospirillales bacterium]|nr:purine-nucleoside phosphorylase [Rhodospirillales bacterium]